MQQQNDEVAVVGLREPDFDRDFRNFRARWRRNEVPDVNAIQNRDEGWTGLHLTALAGDYDLLKSLIEANADVNCTTHELRTPLHETAEQGFVYASRYLLSKGADVNAQDDEGLTPLMCAMSFPLSGVEGVPDMGGEEEDPDMQIGEGLVKILVEAGSDVNTVDGRGQTAVLLAAGILDPPTVKFLLEAGADPKYDAEDSENIAQRAAINEEYNLFPLLLEQGLDPNLKCKSLRNQAPILHEVIRAAKTPDGLRNLLDAGADLEQLDEWGNTVMHAVATSDVEGVWDALQEAGGTRFASEPSLSSWTPLHVASAAGNLYGVQRLLQLGVDVDRLDKDDLPPVFGAGATGNLEVVKSLLEAGCRVDFVEDDQTKTLDAMRKDCEQLQEEMSFWEEEVLDLKERFDAIATLWQGTTPEEQRVRKEKARQNLAPSI